MNLSRRTLLGGLGSLIALPAFAHEIISPEKSGDQTQRLQAAIDEAQRTGIPVSLGKGKFRVRSLRISSAVEIIGSAGQTILEAIDDQPIIDIAKSGTVTLRGLTFSSDDKKTDLVSAGDVKRLYVTECQFIGGGTGLNMQRCSGRIIGNNCQYQENSGIFSNDSKGLEIASNTVSDIGNNGILVWRSEPGEDNSIVTNNHVSRVAARDGGSGQNGNGINVYRAGHVMIANNRVTDCAYSGIRNNSGANSQIIGNSISRANEVALYVEFAFQGAVVADNLITDVGFGISITNFDVDGRLAMCSGNIIRNARGSKTLGVTLGGGIHAEADTIITNNVIEDGLDVGISLGWGPHCRNLTAMNNLIRNCPKGISVSVANGARKAVIMGNTIDNAKQAAVIGMDHLEPATGDLTKAGAAIPAHVSMRGNVVT